MKFYNKNSVVEAEQFNGSKEQMDKYGIHKTFTFRNEDGSPQYEVQLLNIPSFDLFNIGDWLFIRKGGITDIFTDEEFRMFYERVSNEIKSTQSNYS